MGTSRQQRLALRVAKQLGIVTAEQCRELGFSRKWLRDRVDDRSWLRLYRGIFKVGANPPDFDQRELAAMFACGAGAVLSHLSAARRWGLDVPASRRIQLTVPTSQNYPKQLGFDVWRSRELTASEISTRGPFRITHLGRTVLDLASVLDGAWLRAAVDSALRMHPSNLAWMAHGLEGQGAGRAGAERMRSLLVEAAGSDEISDSALESLAMELGLATGRKPRLHWRVQPPNRGLIELDLAWPEVQLNAELDGFAVHGKRHPFSSDRARDRALVGMGWTVLRYTWNDVTKKKQVVINELTSNHHACAHRMKMMAGSER